LPPERTKGALDRFHTALEALLAREPQQAGD